MFPGEQGGPHMHAIAALATTLKIAKTDSFKKLQHQIIKNCAALTNRLSERGLRIPYGGTNTHLGNVDCKSIVGPDGTPLSGDMAARILDIAGVVLNRNTIPGDKTAMASTGIRYGTPWITQRGLVEKDMIALGDIMADVLHATTPYSLETKKGDAIRAKVNFEVLEDAKIRTRKLAENAGYDGDTSRRTGYPHFFYIDDKPVAKTAWTAFELSGHGIRNFVNVVFSSDVELLVAGKSQKTLLHTPKETVEGVITCIDATNFQFSLPAEKAGLAGTWLREMSDGYVHFDADLLRRTPGPIYVVESTRAPVTKAEGDGTAAQKPYVIGFTAKVGKSLPDFTWEEKEPETPRRTRLYDTHKALGAKIIPFAGWDMPVWYTSVVEEHLACRQVAGLFDVSHMGVFQAEGPDAVVFLDSVCGNDIGALQIGESCYTHFLTPDANVIDDLLVYRRGAEKYLVVVNAANDDKDWAWINAAKDGKVKVDNANPSARAFGRNVILRNLRDPKAGADMRVDIALQGPKSRDILLSLGVDAPTRRKIMALKRTDLCEAVVGGIDLVVSRTGYTGEKMAFELFVHPDKAVELWNALTKAGEPLGMKPCGLGARDSLRTEAGLPLYGHEMGGEMNLGVAEAAFGSFVKTYKPWFIGRDAYLAREAARTAEVVRFRFTEKGVRMAHNADPIIDKKGKTVGVVTSCAVDSDGLLTGQAYVDLKAAEEGTQFYIFQGAPKTTGKVPAELTIGDRVTLPTAAVIISRFPK